MTVCPVLEIDAEAGIVRFAYIDAHDSTPVLDIKPYIPVSDRVRDVTVPDWFASWPNWFEDAGEFFANDAGES